MKKYDWFHLAVLLMLVAIIIYLLLNRRKDTFIQKDKEIMMIQQPPVMTFYLTQGAAAKSEACCTGCANTLAPFQNQLYETIARKQNELNQHLDSILSEVNRGGWYGV